jgi:hypothetical protein
VEQASIDGIDERKDRGREVDRPGRRSDLVSYQP